MSFLRKQGRGVMAVSAPGPRSELRSGRFQTVEGTLVFGKTSSFAGRRWNKGLGCFERTEGASSPPVDETATFSGVLKQSGEKGNLDGTLILRLAAGVKWVLCSRLFGPCSPSPSSNGHRRKRWSGRGAARKRRRESGDGSRCHPSRRACSVPSVVIERTVAAHGSRDPSSKGGGCLFS